MYVERYTLAVPVYSNPIKSAESCLEVVARDMILPDYKEATALASDRAAQALDGKQNIQAFSGRRAVSRFGVQAVGSGAKAHGHIHVTGQSYDYKALYDVYHISSNKKVGVWFFNYTRDTSRDELVKTFESSQTQQIDIELDFELTGNDFGETAVFITYEVIRLRVNGETKDFVTTNPDNSGASSPDGSPYPGGFTPVS